MKLTYSKRLDFKNGSYCHFISKRFQGLGILFTADNPIGIKEYYLLKIALFYFVFWIVIDK